MTALDRDPEVRTASDRPTILVTNDDGIDSVGLHVLARAMTDLGAVTVVAPDSEYSGAGASIGALHLADTEIRRLERPELAGTEAAWTVNGSPGLCVFYARMGAFGFVPDLVVSGINPGANLGRAVYHSGTVGAALTARNGNIPAVAVSQKFASTDAQAGEPEDGELDYDALVRRQRWDSAAEVARAVVGGLMETDGLDDVAVLNLNVPNLPTDQIKGWRWTRIGRRPPWAMVEAELVEKEDQPGVYRVETRWGEQADHPTDTDTAALADDLVSISWLSRIEALDWPAPVIERHLDQLLGR